jgi:hypothetical protein
VIFSSARDPLGSGYQVMQAKIATGSAASPKGFLHGTQVNLEYLPRGTPTSFSGPREEWDCWRQCSDALSLSDSRIAGNREQRAIAEAFLCCR